MTTILGDPDKGRLAVKLHKLPFAASFALEPDGFMRFRAGIFFGKNLLARFFSDVRDPLRRQWIALDASKLTVWREKYR